MNRRGFLQGVFGGVTAAGAIVLANPAEIDAFARGLPKEAPVMLGASTPQTAFVDAGEHLYNAKGELVAIVKSMTIHCGSQDASMMNDAWAHYVPSTPHIDIQAVGVGTITRLRKEWR